MRMLLFLAQVQLPDPPRNVEQSIGSWALTVLSILTIAALGYLVLSTREANATAKDAIEGTATLLKDERDRAEARLNKAWDAHEKDREAFLRHQDEITQTLREIREDVREVRKNWGSSK